MKFTRILSIILVTFICCLAIFVIPDKCLAASEIPDKVVITSVKSIDHNAVKVIWKKAINAKKYQVWRATAKNGRYKLIKTTTARTFTNKGLITGKKYYYKIRAINGGQKGKFSSKKYAIPKLKRTSNVKVAATETTVKLTWNKVNGSKGYQIYRSASKNGTYKKIMTTSRLSFTNKNLSVNKNYYYKVRAYKNVNGKVKFGNFSAVKNIKTKNHNYIKKAVPPNCTKQGYTYCKCAGCGHAYKTAYKKALGHSLSSQIATEPTCTKEGIERTSCSNCSYSVDKAIPKVKHKWVSETISPTCYSTGIKKTTCPDCSTVNTKEIPMTPHSWDGGTEVPATCTEDGYTLYVCTAQGCSETKKDNFIAAHHEWEEKYVEVEEEVVEPRIYTECDICYQELGNESEEEHAMKHVGENVSYTEVYDYTGDSTIQTISKLVSRKCTVCGKEESHSHEWVDHYKQVVVGSEWGTEYVKEYYYYCKKCKEEIAGNPNEHIGNHAIAGEYENASWSEEIRYVQKPVWLPIYGTEFDYKECTVCGYTTTDINT